jgi:hypothetical protein
MPRLQLRKRRPAETLQSILTHLGTAVEIVAPLAKEDDGRNIVYSILSVIQATLPWLSRNVQADDPHNHIAKVCTSACFSRSMELLSIHKQTHLLNLLYVTLEACTRHIHASVAQRRFETYNPRLVIRTNVDSNSERGQRVMRNAVVSHHMPNMYYCACLNYFSIEGPGWNAWSDGRGPHSEPRLAWEAHSSCS